MSFSAHPTPTRMVKPVGGTHDVSGRRIASCCTNRRVGQLQFGLVLDEDSNRLLRGLAEQKHGDIVVWLSLLSCFSTLILRGFQPDPDGAPMLARLPAINCCPLD
jgi:hypothetical protein